LTSTPELTQDEVLGAVALLAKISEISAFQSSAIGQFAVATLPDVEAQGIVD